MQWLTENWAVVRLAWEGGSYFNALINPLGILASVLLVALGAVWANGRKGTFLTLFAMWSIATLHHFFLESTDLGLGNVSGVGHVAIFFVGVVVVVGVILYFALVRD
jgi:hypothetical protein